MSLQTSRLCGGCQAGSNLAQLMREARGNDARNRPADAYRLKGYFNQCPYILLRLCQREITNLGRRLATWYEVLDASYYLPKPARRTHIQTKQVIWLYQILFCK